MKALRDAYGDEILELGREYQNLYVIDADVGKSCKTVPFQKLYPEQYINVGISEASAAGVTAGLATCGKIPLLTTYAAFGSMRICEQIRQELCYPKLNGKIMCSHGGLTPANDGASHQCIEDLGIMRTLPNMTVIAPGDYFSARKLIRKAVEMYGPVYMRFTRDAIPFVYSEQDDFEIGKAKKLQNGSDVCIIACGDILSQAVTAANQLREAGISVLLLDMHTIKPLDEAAVQEAIERCGKIITVEDHNILNGLGSAVSDVVAKAGHGIVRKIGVQDHFGESGPYMELLADNGITVENIIKTAQELLTE